MRRYFLKFLGLLGLHERYVISAKRENHFLNFDGLVNTFFTVNIKKTEESVKIRFKDVYGSPEEQLKAVQIFKSILRKRGSIIELRNNDENS